MCEHQLVLCTRNEKILKIFVVLFFGDVFHVKCVIVGACL